MANRSTTPAKRNSKPAKPEKPYQGFPLFPHASGQWAKKIRGKLHYFGVWATPEEALKRFNREWPYLKEGRTPPPENISEDGCTLRELVNDYLNSKEEKLNSGGLSARSFRDYFRTCEIMIDHFGKDRRVDDLRPEDFRSFRTKLAERFSVVTLRNEITRVSMVFNYAFENQLIEKPVVFGQEFDRPSAREIRRHRNSGGGKLYTPEEIHRLIAAADVHLRAMIYLGINCGFGNTDVANLPIASVDLNNGWIEFPRPKTEIERRIPLWPETIAALRESLENRPRSASEAEDGLCFVTQKRGHKWVRVKPKKNATGPEDQVVVDAVSLQFRKLLKKLEINGRRGLGFYSFRHCTETIGGESRDQVAVDAIMGHVDPSMGGNYRHAISDDRLRAVVDVVRAWLFSGESTEGGER